MSHPQNQNHLNMVTAWHLLVTASILGAGMLTLEILWLRTLSQALGGGARSMAAMTAAFFLATAVGNLVGARCSVRGNQTRQASILLITAAATALLTELIRPRLLAIIASQAWLGNWTHPVAAIALSAPTFIALSAVWPCLAAAIDGSGGPERILLGRIQAADLFGAGVGALLAGLLLPAWLGLSGAILASSALLALTGATLLLCRSEPTKPTIISQEIFSSPVATWFGWLLVAASGVLTILSECIGFTQARQFGTQSALAASAVLAATLIDLAMGAAIVSRLRQRQKSWALLVTLFLGLASIGAALLPLAAQLLQTANLTLLNIPPIWHPIILGLSAIIVLAPLLVPAGGILPLAWEKISPRRNAGSALGPAQAINCLCAATSALAWPWILPLIELNGIIWVVTSGYAILAMVAVMKLKIIPRWPAVLCVITATLFTLLRIAIPQPMILGAANLLGQSSDPAAEIAIIEDTHGSRHIILDRSYQLNGTGEALLQQRMESWLPLLLTPQPHRTAYIGMASGIGASAILDRRDVERLAVAEVVTGVVTAAKTHFSEWNSPLWHDRRVEIRATDGRQLILTDPDEFDLIVVTLIQPSEEGAASLWSRDFFTALSHRLHTGGSLCLWLPAFQCDEAMLSSVFRSFLEAFPHSLLLRAGDSPLSPAIGLMGSNHPFALDDTTLNHNLASLNPLPSLPTPAHLRSYIIGDLRGIADQFAEAAPITDDRPLPAYRAIDRRTGLRGIHLLKWIGNRFLGKPLPSCQITAEDEPRLRAEIRAGNWRYAAACWSISDPHENLAATQQRMRQAAEARAMIHRLAPALTQPEFP